MSANDPLKWISLQNEIRQTQLLSDIRRGQMSPSERQADDAANMAAWRLFWRTFLWGGLAITLAAFAILGYFSWCNYENTRPPTASEVSNAISGHLGYHRSRRYGFSNVRHPNIRNVFLSERRLSDEAIDIIASSNVDFYPTFDLTDSQLQRLSKKRDDGWLILGERYSTSSNRYGNIEGAMKHFQGSEASVWLVNPDPKDLSGWATHKGKMRVGNLDIEGDRRENVDRALEMLEKGGKEIERLSYE
jgi:hypothetical protein